jgi:hypothetical protein
MPSPGGALYDFSKWLDPSRSPQAVADRAKEKAREEEVERNRYWQSFWDNVSKTNILGEAAAKQAGTVAQIANTRDKNTSEIRKGEDTHRAGILAGTVLPAQTAQAVAKISADGNVRKELIGAASGATQDIDTRSITNRINLLNEVTPLIDKSITGIQTLGYEAANQAILHQRDENARNFDRLKELHAMSQPKGFNKFIGSIGALADTASRIAYAVDAFRG